MSEATAIRPVRPQARVGQVVRDNPLLTAGIVLLAVITAAAIAAPLLAPNPADAGTAIEPGNTFLPPSAAHPFGTDFLGRDILSRVLFGGRLSLEIVVLVLVIATVVGVPLGALAGYFGGVIDQVIMRITDVFLAFPPLLLALAIAFVFGPSVRNMILAIAAT